jgi:hypothetical protein
VAQEIAAFFGEDEGAYEVLAGFGPALFNQLVEIGEELVAALDGTGGDIGVQYGAHGDGDFR